MISSKLNVGNLTRGERYPYQIVHVYGAHLILRLTVDEDASPKLVGGSVVGVPHKSHQSAELEVARLAEIDDRNRKDTRKLYDAEKKERKRRMDA